MARDRSTHSGRRTSRDAIAQQPLADRSPPGSFRYADRDCSHGTLPRRKVRGARGRECLSRFDCGSAAILYAETQYLTSEAIRIAIARRLSEPDGPEIVLVTPKECCGFFEKQTMGVITARLMRDLKQSDVFNHLRLYSPRNARQDIYVHAKVMVIDDRWARVASSNLSNRSMGVDTECDIIIECKEGSRGSQAIRDLRNRLLGEHLGCAPALVEARTDECRSLIGAIESLLGKGRTLYPADFDACEEELLVSTDIADPVRPVDPEHLVRTGEFRAVRRPTFGALVVVAALLALALAWRFTPLEHLFRARANRALGRAIEGPRFRTFRRRAGLHGPLQFDGSRQPFDFRYGHRFWAILGSALCLTGNVLRGGYWFRDRAAARERCLAAKARISRTGNPSHRRPTRARRFHHRPIHPDCFIRVRQHACRCDACSVVAFHSGNVSRDGPRDCSGHSFRREDLRSFHELERARSLDVSRYRALGTCRDELILALRGPSASKPASLVAVEAFGPDGDPPDMSFSKPYRAATYNVHGCIGTDGRHSPERVANVISELDADVIALQEVSTLEHDGKTTDQLAWLAERTGYMFIAGPTLSRGAGPFGNAILTRHAPLQVRRHDLSVPGFEPRGALDVNLDVDGVEVRLVATHLGLRARERQRQVALLLDAIEHRSNPLILLGDFNEWFPKTTVGRRLSKLGEWSHPRTYPSFFPIFALDRIWTFPIQLLERPPSAHRSALARTASDHLPLVADLATIGIE